MLTISQNPQCILLWYLSPSDCREGLLGRRMVYVVAVVFGQRPFPSLWLASAPCSYSPPLPHPTPRLMIGSGTAGDEVRHVVMSRGGVEVGEFWEASLFYENKVVPLFFAWICCVWRQCLEPCRHIAEDEASPGNKQRRTLEGPGTSMALLGC